MNVTNQIHTQLIASEAYVINGMEKVTVDIHRIDTLAADSQAAESHGSLFDSLSSFLATSKFGQIATRGIAIIDLVLLSVDLFGLLGARPVSTRKGVRQ